MSDLSATNCGCGCERNERSGFGNNSCLWIILLLFCCGGCGNGFSGNNNGCGDSCIWINPAGILFFRLPIFVLVCFHSFFSCFFCCTFQIQFINCISVYNELMFHLPIPPVILCYIICSFHNFALLLIYIYNVRFRSDYGRS